jgi:hypothetical protein
MQKKITILKITTSFLKVWFTFAAWKIFNTINRSGSRKNTNKQSYRMSSLSKTISSLKIEKVTK